MMHMIHIICSIDYTTWRISLESSLQKEGIMKTNARFKSWIHNDSAASDSVVQYHATARTNWLVGKVLCLI